MLPYWDGEIAPRLAAGRDALLIAAHGNSLRAIVKLLFDVSDQAIPGVEIPTGNPLLIELDAGAAADSPRAISTRARARSSRSPRRAAPVWGETGLRAVIAVKGSLSDVR